MKRLIFAIGWALNALLMIFILFSGIYTDNMAPLLFAVISLILSVRNSISEFARWKRNEEIEKMWKNWREEERADV